MLAPEIGLVKFRWGPKKMRVMHVLDLYADKLGGIEEFLIKQSQVIQGQNGKSIVVFRDNSKEVQDLMTAAGAEVIQISSEITSFTYLKSLALEVFKSKPDVIVFHFFSHRNILPAIIGFITRIPCVFVDHHSGEGRRHYSFKKILSWVSHQFSLSRFSKIVAVSNFVKYRQINKTGMPEDKVKVIYNGTRPANQEEIKKSFSIRKELGISESAFIIMGVGNLIQEKGFHVLIEAFSKIKNDNDNLHLVIVGDGTERKNLEEQVRTLNLKQVLFLGRRSDVQSLYWMADVVACPSIWAEAFCLTVAEAMINKRLVIASSVGGIPELIDNEVTGLHVEPENAEGLQKAIERVISNPDLRSKLSLAARKRAHELFHIDRNVQQSLDLLREVINAKS
jgi:glycosyltransferase involved in cell wall biosynthesis